MKYLLQQDDCAPDSLESFKEQIEKKFNLKLSDFLKNKPKLTNDGMTLNWYYKGFVLSKSADDPFYILSKEKE